ncbi:hypothetical protein [Amycolatopsis tucumanensis]|uniref:Secreted peptide n=1 Tax=Amycolatopsis tucumanensis TaxID=401106 RepID=A0ABP7I7Q1_9PSEU|nr:hypothetical protein [Amycolatopsis tucumanensis]
MAEQGTPAGAAFALVVVLVVFFEVEVFELLDGAGAELLVLGAGAAEVVVTGGALVVGAALVTAVVAATCCTAACSEAPPQAPSTNTAATAAAASTIFLTVTRFPQLFGSASTSG